MFGRDRSLLQTHRTDDSSVVVARVTANSLSQRHTAAFLTATDELIEAEHPLVVFDMESVSYIDSAGLGVLVRAVKLSRDRGGDVALANLTSEVRVLIELMRLHELIDIYNTPEEALRVVAAPSDAVAGDLEAAGLPEDELLAVRGLDNVAELEAIR